MERILRGLQGRVVAGSAAALSLCLAMTVGGHAQATPVSQAGTRLEFDVASVKQNKSDDKPSSTFSLDNGNV
jgi:hypothetical protein